MTRTFLRRPQPLFHAPEMCENGKREITRRSGFLNRTRRRAGRDLEETAIALWRGGEKISDALQKNLVALDFA
jgi:hypothetical protein